MKKQAKKITLSKETLLKLEEARVSFLIGGQRQRLRQRHLCAGMRQVRPGNVLALRA